jgi:HK97 gp10 family phage protein
MDYIYGRRKTMPIAGGGRVVWNPRPLQAVIDKAVAPALKKSAELVARLARQEVPVGTVTRAATKFASWKGRKPGDLKKSIKVKKSQFKDGGYIVMVGGRDTYYWFFVHYGTHVTYPNWFMTRALRMAKARMGGRLPMSWVGIQSTGRSQSPQEPMF